jgi:hypothetical protein
MLGKHYAELHSQLSYCLFICVSLCLFLAVLGFGHRALLYHLGHTSSPLLLLFGKHVLTEHLPCAQPSSVQEIPAFTEYHIY